jgi:DNA-binding response OmpR family regulator
MNIEDLGLQTKQVHDGETGLHHAMLGVYDLVILDVMMPKMDGITVCKKIRENDSFTPILMLTAKAEEIDRVLGLELGADDYMTKPFSMRELAARVKALLRRSQAVRPPSTDEQESEDDKVQIGDLLMDFKKHRTLINGAELDLTVKEFELLGLFVRNPGRAYSRADLLNLVWGYNFEGYEHTVNTHINRIRNKIESDPANPRYLLTVWGIGYRFAEMTEVSS